MDPHRNIFYYYSGSRKREDQIVYDRQLENNTTKTLINVFENSSPAVTAKFLEFILNKRQPQTQYHYGLQRKPFVSDEAQTKVLLCISPDKKTSKRDGSPGGIPDAWIYDFKGRIVVAVESKVQGSVSNSQIRGHLKSLNWKQSDAKVIHLNWTDIYAFLCRVCNQSGKEFGNVFLQQGIKYLEYIGMDKFNGFKNEDFDYFIAPNSEYKPILKKKIERFTSLLKEKIHIKQEYKEFQIGNLRSGGEHWAWVAIKRSNNRKDPFSQCNFTVEIKSEGLEVNVVFRNGRHTQVKKPIGYLYKKLENQFSEFMSILKRLGPGAYIELFERKSKQGGIPRQGNEAWHMAFHLQLGNVTNEAIMHLQALMRDIDFPGIHIGYKIKRGSSLLTDHKGLFDQINKCLVSLKPALDFVVNSR